MYLLYCRSLSKPPCLPYLLFVIFLHNRNLRHGFASRQNSVNYHSRTQIMNCVKIMICMLNCESNYILCKIARWVKHYTKYKIAHSVKKFHSKHFLSCTLWKILPKWSGSNSPEWIRYIAIYVDLPSESDIGHPD